MCFCSSKHKHTHTHTHRPLHGFHAFDGNIILHTHFYIIFSHHTETKHTHTQTHTDPHRPTLCSISSPALRSPGGFSLDEMSLLMEMGNGITKGMFSRIAFHVEGEGVPARWHNAALGSWLMRYAALNSAQGGGHCFYSRH